MSAKHRWANLFKARSAPCSSLAVSRSREGMEPERLDLEEANAVEVRAGGRRQNTPRSASLLSADHHTINSAGNSQPARWVHHPLLEGIPIGHQLPFQLGIGMYFNLKTIPMFSGREEDATTLEDFLAGVESLILLTPDLTPAELRIAMAVRTKHEARDFVQELKLRQLTSYSEIKKTFKLEFEPPENRCLLEREFNECRQRNSDSVFRYYSNLMSILRKLREVTPLDSDIPQQLWDDYWDRRATSQFMHGLKTDLLREIGMFDPGTLKEAKQLALRAEKTMKIYQARVDEEIRAAQVSMCVRFDPLAAASSTSEPRALLEPPSQRGHHQEPTKTSYRGRSPRRQDSDGKYTCFLCKQTGHRLQDCQYLYCMICKQYGHCPADCLENPKNND